MAIIRVSKRENPFVQIDKTGVNDSRLSWKATGLLVYLIGRPDNWKIRVNHLAEQKKDGVDATKAALRELRQYGYCHYFQIKEKGRIKDTHYVISEVPTFVTEDMLEEIKKDYKDADKLSFQYISVKKTARELEVDFPEVESPQMDTPQVVFPQVDSPRVEKQQLIIQEYNNREYNNKESNKKEEINKRNQQYHDQYQEEQVHKEEHGLALDFDDDFFEKIFKELGVAYTRKNRESLRRMPNTMSREDVKRYLYELYENIQKTPNVKNPQALFSHKLAKCECQMLVGQSYLPKDYEARKREEAEERASGRDLMQELEDAKNDCKVYESEEELEAAWQEELQEMQELLDSLSEDTRAITLRGMRRAWLRNNRMVS